MPSYILQRCGNCGKTFRSSGRWSWCFQCYQSDPAGCKIAMARGKRSGWIHKLSQLEKHDSIVYAVHLGGNRVKVGHTTSIKHRVQSYRTTIPHAHPFWGTWGDRFQEQLYHDQLDRYRIESREVFALGNIEEATLKLEDAEHNIKAETQLAA